MVIALSGSWVRAQSRDIQLAVFESEPVTIHLKDGLPVPAADGRIKVEVAGLATGVDPKDPARRTLFWMFSFTQKSGPKVERVVVEEIYPKKPARLVLTDGAPDLKANGWSGRADGGLIGESSTPWLFEAKDSAFLFRFTILFEGGAKSVLYQLSMFPAQAKTYLIRPAAKQ